jgi:hypothetical protein
VGAGSSDHVSAWAPSRARGSIGVPSAPPASALLRRERRRMPSHAMHGVSGCWGTAARPSRPHARRRAECELPLSRGSVSWLRHPSNRRARHHMPTKNHSRSRIGALYAMQGLLAGPRLSFTSAAISYRSGTAGSGRRSMRIGVEVKTDPTSTQRLRLLDHVAKRRRRTDPSEGDARNHDY